MKKFIFVLCNAMFCIFIFSGSTLTFTQKKENENLLGKVSILMYHNVVSNWEYVSTFAVAKEQLEEDFKYLRDNDYVALMPSQLIAYVETNTPLPSKCVMITFDDGYLNDEEIVLPLLEKYDLNCTLCVVGSYAQLGKSNPKVGKVYAYLELEDMRKAMESGRVELAAHSYAMHSQKNRQGVKIKWREDEKHYKKLFAEDTIKNEEFLKQLNVKPVCFAYPFGSYCKQSEEVLKKLGYKITLTCEEGINKISGTDSLYLMKRCNRTDKRCARYLLQKFN